MKRNETEILTPLQEKAVNFLLTGKSLTAVATELKIGRVTIYRWLNHPIFKGELEQRQREINQAVSHRIQSLATKSVDRLETLLDSDDPSLVFKAATFLLSRIPFQSNDSCLTPNWEQDLKREASSLAKRELDKLYGGSYGSYEIYLRLDKTADQTQVRNKRIELEQKYFEQLKRELSAKSKS
jgi:DNA invertase Pin-like site-specific DNA recombinase